MKKLLSLLASFAIATPVLAASFGTDYRLTLDKDHVQLFVPVTIDAEADGEITAEHGINLLLADDAWILWHNEPIELDGTAVTNGRVPATLTPTFDPGYKVLHIDVEEDFLAGERLRVTGLRVRTYDRTFRTRYLGLDLDGDHVADVEEANGYKVDDVDRADNTFPYPVYDVAYSINPDGSLQLTWNKPPDYDIAYMRVDRWTTKEDQTTYKAKAFYDTTTTFTDTSLVGADSVRYLIQAEDYRAQMSDPVEVIVDLTAPAPEEPTVLEPVEEEPTAEAPQTEIEELSKLLNYYNVRYQIKCLPSGVPVAENDSACLWARIDLIYAQEITGEVLVEGVALTDRDLELMALRRKWPEMRYEDNCVNADTPADYCSALGKALNRISYFLD